MSKIKHKKSFSLIELILVMAVIIILGLLAMPKLMGNTKEAKFTNLIKNTKQIENASERYYINIKDWPRLTDEPYSASEITAFAQKVYDSTGKEVVLDVTGKYYDIDYGKLSKYIQIPNDKQDYIIQNPTGKVYALQNLTIVAKTRAINKQVTGVTLEKSTIAINENSTVQLKAISLPITAVNKIVTWSSSDNNIVTVSNTGLVTGITLGSSIITVTTQDGGYTSNCTIVVYLPE